MVSLRSHLAGWFAAFMMAIWLWPVDAMVAADMEAVVTRWLAAQANVSTWKAGFVQTRTLSTLSQPLTTAGKVEFASPNRFRWELGDPPQTVAIREPDRITILYPRLKRAERYPLDAKASGPWKDAMALLDAGFPRSRAELESRFTLQPPREIEPGICLLAMRPRAANVRKMLTEVQVLFSSSSLELTATQMKFADGSILRNDFTNVVINADVDNSRFKPVIDEDFKVSEPARR